MPNLEFLAESAGITISTQELRSSTNNKVGLLAPSMSEYSCIYGVVVLVANVEIVRCFRGRISNFNQSKERKQCFPSFDWLKFETLPP